jgi:long-chain fatty acid transport protein
MRPRRLPSICLSLLALTLTARSAAASGFGLFQHGGRATGQAGAFVARADDPAAIAYNPAGLVQASGLELLGGVDFGAARDDFQPRGGGDRVAAKHQINLTPAIYLAWRPDRPGPALAFGVGVDAALWNTVHWTFPFFPDADLARRAEVRLFEVHPTAAYELDERWSVGGGVRYLFGDIKEGRALTIDDGPDPDLSPTSGEKLAQADVDGLGFDLGVQYRSVAFGFGAVWRSAVEVEGSSRVAAASREFVHPLERDHHDAALAAAREQPRAQSFELASELRLGAWIAPYPELRIELDLVRQFWGSTDNAPSAADLCALRPCGTARPGDWDDTTSVRLGVEGDLGDSVLLYGGVAWEPSPVAERALEPGLPRGDAVVYAFGASYEFPQLSFDLGYSLHDHQSIGGDFTAGRYSARDQAFAVSARWRF